MTWLVIFLLSLGDFEYFALYFQIKLHPTMDTLHPYVPQEILPKDYGGTADSLEEIHKNGKKALVENEEYFKETDHLKADESKRIGKQKNASDLFGIEGSFKKLNID